MYEFFYHEKYTQKNIIFYIVKYLLNEAGYPAWYQQVSACRISGTTLVSLLETLLKFET